MAGLRSHLRHLSSAPAHCRAHRAFLRCPVDRDKEIPTILSHHFSTFPFPLAPLAATTMAPLTSLLTKDVEALGAEFSLPTTYQEKQLLRERDQDQYKDQDQAVPNSDRRRERRQRAIMASPRGILLALLVCCLMTLGLASAKFNQARGSCHDEGGDVQQAVGGGEQSSLSSLLSSSEIRGLLEKFHVPVAKRQDSGNTTVATTALSSSTAATVSASSSSVEQSSASSSSVAQDTASSTTAASTAASTAVSTSVETSVQVTTTTAIAQTTSTAIPTPSDSSAASSGTSSATITSVSPSASVSTTVETQTSSAIVASTSSVSSASTSSQSQSSSSSTLVVTVTSSIGPSSSSSSAVTGTSVVGMSAWLHILQTD